MAGRLFLKGAVSLQHALSSPMATIAIENLMLVLDCYRYSNYYSALALFDGGGGREEGPVLPTNEADGLVAELAEVQELQKKMSRLLKKVAQRGERRVEEVEAVEHEVAQLPAEGPSDFADRQDLPEDPPQEPASDGLEFEGSESEDPQRSCRCSRFCAFA